MSGVPTLSPQAEGHTVSSNKRELDGDPTGSPTPRMHGNTSHENREIPAFPDGSQLAAGRSGKSEDARR